jgi:hypothetical protein
MSYWLWLAFMRPEVNVTCDTTLRQERSRVAVPVETPTVLSAEQLG